ncbi:MAG: hypothetical protein JWM79_1713, partial [Nocardioides sp.]|nr:hypothetical protein [Nocardioides sp.]
MSETPGEQEQQVVIIGPDGQPMASVPASALTMGPPSNGSDDGEGDERAITDLVEQPAKVMRIGS